MLCTMFTYKSCSVSPCPVTSVFSLHLLEEMDECWMLNYFVDGINRLPPLFVCVCEREVMILNYTLIKI